MTIDVAKLRSLARYQNDAVIAAEEITELLDAYEERERLRASLQRAITWMESTNDYESLSPTGHALTRDEIHAAKRALEGRE